MQSSSFPPRLLKLKKHNQPHQPHHSIENNENNDNDNDTSFSSFCNSIGVIYYTTKGKYFTTNLIWNQICSDRQSNDIRLETFDEAMIYLNQKLDIMPPSKKFIYEYIIRELNNYGNMSEKFASNYNNYIRRLKSYAKKRKCKNMYELKQELTHYLRRYVVDVEYVDRDNKDNKNDYVKQDWLIISRYICDFLEEQDEINDTFESAKLFN